MTAEIYTAVSTMYEPGENPGDVLHDGNVLQRLCAVRSTIGESACNGCELFEESLAAQVAREKSCADRNLLTVLAEHDVSASETLMVGVTGDKVGFYDAREKTGDVTEHRFGWQMTAGYNAYFARTSELRAMGARLADCSFVEVTADLPGGDTVFGLIHMTRGNIQGESAYSYGPQADTSFVAYSLGQMTKHYGIDASAVRLRQVAKIDKLDYRFGPTELKDGTKLTAEQNMDRLFAGWFDQDMLHNTTNPAWKRGDPIDPGDAWVADYQQMTEHVLLTSGVPVGNVMIAGAINPGDVQGGHASNAAANDMHRAPEDKRPDGRDAYLVIAKETQAAKPGFLRTTKDIIREQAGRAGTRDTIAEAAIEAAWVAEHARPKAVTTVREFGAVAATDSGFVDWAGERAAWAESIAETSSFDTN